VAEPDRKACEATVCEYISRLLDARASATHPYYAPLVARLERVLNYHGGRFAEAGKGTDTRWLIRELRAGRLARKVYHNCDLLEDVFLAALMELGEDGAFRAFDKRFAAKLAQWSRTYVPWDPTWGDSILAALFEPRAKSGSRISRYAGKGPLEGFVRETVRKLAMQARIERAPRGERQVDTEAGGFDGLAVQPVVKSAPSTPEVEYDRRHCRELLAPLFQRSFEVLAARDRAVLLQVLVDGVEQTRIAREIGLPVQKAYKVFRMKERAIKHVAQEFRRLASKAASQDTVMVCLELLRDRLSDLPLDLEAIRGARQERNMVADTRSGR
jgi:DNA-directed RNA polymerase specialized sigma24 family protein